MSVQEATPRVRNRRAEITDDHEKGTVTFKFSDGVADLVCDVTKLPAAIVRRCVVSRVHNKLMDSYADPSTEPRHEATGVWQEMLAGVWSQRGEAGPRKPTLLIEAFAELFGKDWKTNPELAIQKADAFIAKQSEAAVAQFKSKKMVNESNQIVANPIYAKMEEIKARRAAERARNLKKEVAGLKLADIHLE